MSYEEMAPSLSERCPKCNETRWAGDQEITAPRDFRRPYWHRRTHCLFCNWVIEEIGDGGVGAITSRTEGIRWWGRNPWL